VIGAAFGFAWRKGYLARVADYVAETREELRKCTWPTLEELKGSTVVVMITIVLLSLFIVASDFLILKFVRGVLPKL
jgi:preprotein translocase subunit SecE